MERQKMLNDSTGGAESLREECQGPFSRNSFEYEQNLGLRHKPNFVEIEQRPRAPSLGDILVLSPKLNVPTKKKTTPEKNRYNWSVGDRVVAYISSQGSWRDGVVHEVDASAALIVCNDSSIRPTYVDFSLLKPGAVPAEAFNKFDYDVSNILNKTKELSLQSTKPKAKEMVQDPFCIPRRSECVLSATMSPNMIMSASSSDFCQFAKTGAGSKYLQNLVMPSNRVLCHRMLEHLLTSTDSPTLKLMTNAKACYVFQKLLTHLYIFSEAQQESLLAEIENNFSKLCTNQFGYQLALAVLTHLGMEQGRRFALKMENKPLLHGLIRNDFGTFVAQACIPLFQKRTVNFVVNSLLGHVVDLSRDKNGAFFIQKFIEQWGHLPEMNLFIDDIIRHLRSIVHHPIAAFVVQKILEVRRDLDTYIKIIDWILANIEAVYKNEISVKVLKVTIDQVNVSFKMSSIGAQWKELLDKVVFKLLIGVNSEGRSHIVAASCHLHGHKIMIALLKNSSSISDNVKRNLLETITSYRTSLSANKYGCKILALAQGFD